MVASESNQFQPKHTCKGHYYWNWSPGVNSVIKDSILRWTDVWQRRSIGLDESNITGHHSSVCDWIFTPRVNFGEVDANIGAESI